MKKLRRNLFLGFLLALVFTVSGCNSSELSSLSETSAPSDNSEQVPETANVDLSGQSLLIYCGAGMANPFQEISDAFKEETGCEMQVTYGNAGQIQSQINTVQEGDFFIAGSQDELKPLENVVTSSISLVKHIPVLAVLAGNPKNIKGIEDLANPDIIIVLGDAESTPIGKIADKALTDFGIFDQVNIISRTTTAPAIFTALSAEECDAIIVWKENAKDKSVEIVDTSDLDSYIKTVPAAALSYSKEEEASTAFLAFLDGETVKEIWIKYGYELIE